MRTTERKARGAIRKTEGRTIRIAYLVLILASLAGCVKPPESKPSPDANKIETPTAEVETEKLSMRKYASDGTILWEVSAAGAKGELSPKGDFTEVRGVTAVIYDSGKPGFNIRADHGKVSKSTGKLDLVGGVRAKSEDGLTSLSCDRIAWNNDQRQLFATGNVSGESKGVSIGPADSATAKFKNIDKKMNTSTATTLVLTSLLLQGPRIHYRDGAGNMDIVARTFSVKFDEAANLYRFNGAGSPIIAKWLKQGITVSAATVNGTFANLPEANQSNYELRSATFTGDIHASMKGEKGEFDISSVKSFSLERQGAATWKFSGAGAPFTVKLPSSGATITGHEFEGVAAQVNGKPEWQSATFSGGVTAVVTQLDEKSKKTYTITANCPRVTLDRGAHTVTLSGGAKADGNHPALGPGGAQLEASTVVLEFDDAMRKVVGVTFH